MKLLYIELAVCWAGIAAFNFLLFSTNHSWVCFLGGVVSLLNVVKNVYYAGREDN